MRRPLKYKLKFGTVTFLDMTPEAKTLCVRYLNNDPNGAGVYIWIEADLNDYDLANLRTWELVIVPTGEGITDGFHYVGTAFENSSTGELVLWHVYKRVREKS